MTANELMDIYKRVRKSRGWNHYEMSKALRITQTQLNHYEEKPISTRELLLVKLQEMSGLSVEEFWELLRKEAETEDQKRIKKLIAQIK